jgi:L-threonylcarbamoyladenylate synthase
MSYVTDHFDDKVEWLLKRGVVGFMPSDTIYGLSCRALDQEAVGRIYELKNRDFDKPNIVLIANLDQLDELNVDKRQAELIKQYWPCPLSLIFNGSNIPDWLGRGTNTLAIRMPAHEGLRSLIAKVGPIVSTSANKQGMEPAKSVAEAVEYFGDALDFYIDAGTINNPPSTLVAIRNGKLVIEREGAIKI